MFSGKIQALTIELISQSYSHTDLGMLFLKLDLNQFDPDGNKANRVRGVVENFKASKGGEGVDALLLELIQDYATDKSLDWLQKTSTWSTIWNRLIPELNNAGWSFQSGKFIPTTPDVAPLAPEVDALTADLQDLGLEIAERHYAQAVDNFRQKNHEASNSQLRSFLENLYIELCVRKTAKRFTDPTAAVRSLQTSKALDNGELNIARGMFEASNERGSHHGLSTEQEATFRFHFSTALGRYLIARLK